MDVMESLMVLGEKVDLLVTTASSNGSFCMLLQTSPPGGGPPPHVHEKEDEVFVPLEGEYEIFDGERWTPAVTGQPAYKFRGQPHTFRNRGTTEGKMLAIAMPGGLDNYFRELAPLKMPDDAEEVFRISAEYGIRFLTPETPDEPPL